MIKTLQRNTILLLILLSTANLFAQNSMVGDGFGGRLWYKPSNYTVGSYSAYTICGCDSTSQLYAWGHNYFGQLGNGHVYGNGSNTPISVLNMMNVRYYTSGYCAASIKNDNSGWAWGGLLELTIPTKVIDSVNFVDVGEQVCTFIKNDGTVWSIGSNGYSVFGIGDSNIRTTVPVRMLNINTAVRVACGGYNNIILLKDGTLVATGNNSYGVLGNGVVGNSTALIPIPISGLTNIIDIKANKAAIAALDKDGYVYTWGTSEFGYIGNGIDTDYTNIPIKLNSLKNIVAISGCDDGVHFLALDADHNCYGWGSSAYGAIGSGNLIKPLSPVLVATDVIDIMAGETFSYILKSDGTLWASGYSNGNSIWMNLSDRKRDTFTKIDPTVSPMNLCKPFVLFTSFANTTDASCNSTGIITVTHVGGKAPYTYSIGSGYQNSNVFTNLPAGNYTVSVRDSAGCTSTVLTTVGSSTNAITNLSKTISNATCTKNNGVINLGTVTGGVAPFQYNVNGSGFSSATHYNNLSAGNYTIIVKDSNGCNYTTNAVINNIGAPSSETITDTICNGRIYSFNGNNLSEEGNYSDTLINASGCDSVIYLQLTVTPTPIIHLGRDTMLCEGDTLRLDVTTLNGSYVWQDGSTLPYYIVTQDGQYNVTVKTTCINTSDTIEVTYKSCEETACTYFIPTAFSPNADGNNDEFKIRSNCELSGFIIIYNRFGNEVFKTTDLTTGWNGKYKEETLQADVYAFYTEFTMNNKREIRKGNITLLK